MLAMAEIESMLVVSIDRLKAFLEGLALVLRVGTRRELLLRRILSLRRYEALIGLVRRWWTHGPRKASSVAVAWSRRQVPLLHHHLLVHGRLLLLSLSHGVLSSLLISSLPHQLPFTFANIYVTKKARASGGSLARISANIDERLSCHSSHVFLVTS